MWKLTDISSVFHKEAEQSSGTGFLLHLVADHFPVGLWGQTHPKPAPEFNGLSLCSSEFDRAQTLWQTWTMAGVTLGDPEHCSPQNRHGFEVDGWLKIERIFVFFMKWWFSKICCGKGNQSCETRLPQCCSHQGSINQGRDNSARQGKHSTFLQGQGHVPWGQHTHGRQVSYLPHLTRARGGSWAVQVCPITETRTYYTENKREQEVRNLKRGSFFFREPQHSWSAQAPTQAPSVNVTVLSHQHHNRKTTAWHKGSLTCTPKVSWAYCITFISW